MREIKFQVRNKATGRIIGYEALFPSDVANTDYNWACSVNGSDWMPGLIYERGTLLQREQFTGLHDKNGKEIYEGDIVSLINEPGWDDSDHMQGTGPVVWDQDEARFGWQRHDYIGLLSWGGTASIEIIGNIYEDPELLATKSTS